MSINRTKTISFVHIGSKTFRKEISWTFLRILEVLQLWGSMTDIMLSAWYENIGSASVLGVND